MICLRMKQPCLKKGDFEKTLVPPLRRGARGDLGLIVKQQSLTGFDVKLTLRRALGVSLGGLNDKWVYLITAVSAVNKALSE